MKFSPLQMISTVLLLAVTLSAQAPQRTQPWPKEVLQLAEHLPVQDGGRVKPLSTLARFQLLRIHGKQVFRLDGEKLSATAWLMDCLFFPSQAMQYEVYTIADSRVLEDLGLEAGNKKRRDRYSHAFLVTAAQTLRDKGQEYFDAKQKKQELDTVQSQVLDLAHRFNELDGLFGFLDFARVRVPLDKDKELQDLFPGKQELRFADAVQAQPRLKQLDPQPASLGPALQFLQSPGRWAGRLPIFPPKADDHDPRMPFFAKGEVWLSPRDLSERAFGPGGDLSHYHAALVALQNSVDRVTDMSAFAESFAVLQKDLVQKAEARGEYAKLPMEVSYHNADYFYISLLLFLFSFLTVIVNLLLPRFKLLYLGSWALQVAGLGLLTYGIVIRCVIRGRPPVSTLYESFLFITAVGVMLLMVTEWINRKRIAQLVAGAAGALILTLSFGYMGIDGQDTMPTLVAVLDTNFWLATHVTTVTMGYSAGLFAGLLAVVYILGKAFGIARQKPEFYGSISRMVYGIICFGLLFSTVGTILGGVWANDSWGRFWGWDPKENGALIIVLCQLIILHARMGGYLRQFGICMASIVMALWVVFSWFHVNQLGVGLHSYGFSSGINSAIWASYYTGGGILLVGFVAWFFEKNRAHIAREVEKAKAQAGQGDQQTESPAS